MLFSLSPLYFAPACQFGVSDCNLSNKFNSLAGLNGLLSHLSTAQLSVYSHLLKVDTHTEGGTAALLVLFRRQKVAVIVSPFGGNFKFTPLTSLLKGCDYKVVVQNTDIDPSVSPAVCLGYRLLFNAFLQSPDVS